MTRATSSARARVRACMFRHEAGAARSRLLRPLTRQGCASETPQQKGVLTCLVGLLRTPHTPPPSGPSRGHFGIADLGVPGLWVLLDYAPKVPRLPWRKRSRPFGRGHALQTRFCLCTQYCCNTRWKCPQHLLSVLCPNTHVWNLRTTYGPACSHSKLLHAVFCDRGAACMPEALS